MSFIQDIRDKYAKVAVVLIALALLGFILMDAFTGRSNLFGGNSTTIGKVNGKKFEWQEFAKELENYKQNQQDDDNAHNKAVHDLWDYKVNRTLLEEEFERLGLVVSQKEMTDLIYGANPSPYMRQFFGDPQTGEYDPTRVMQIINQVRRGNKKEDKEQLNLIIDAVEYNRLTEKYTSLLTQSVNFPKWFVEQQATDQSMIAQIAYVAIPYTTVADSSIKITDDEIEEYIEKRKKQYDQKDETRSISYVVFSAAATSGDTAAIRSEVEGLKNEFATTTSPEIFLKRYGSAFPFDSTYLSESMIQVPAKDSILPLPVGGTFGPYLDKSHFVIAKKLDQRILPDSVKCRHILLGTQNPQTGQPLLEDSIAKYKADSVAAAIAGGANFDTLAAKYSTDLAAQQEKGVMTFDSRTIQGQGFAKEFGQFILFDGKPGDKKVVRTSYGYHYIEIMQHMNPKMHHRIAYLSNQIIPSDETDRAAINAATQFSGDSRSMKSFDENYDKHLRTRGINKASATGIRENDYNINGIGVSRALVKKIFDADKDDVLQPEKVGDNYIVAAVSEVNEKGLMSAETARPLVEPVLRNRKKAEQIKKKIGNITTLEAVAQATGQQVQPMDSLRFSNSALAFEYKLVGAAFNPANKGKVVPQVIEGNSGVYVIRVDNQSATPVETANVEQQRKALQGQFRSQVNQAMQYNTPGSPINVLRKSASIKDNRSNFY